MNQKQVCSNFNDENIIGIFVYGFVKSKLWQWQWLRNEKKVNFKPYTLMFDLKTVLYNLYNFFSL